MANAWQNMRYALRLLRNRPGFALAVILTLGVGIGASTAIFSILQGTVLRPLPYPRPDRLIFVRGSYLPTGGGGPNSVPNYLDLRQQVRSVDVFAGYSQGAVNLATDEAPVRASTINATDNFLEALGVHPALGRGFLPGEDREGAARVVIITDRLWRDRFGARPDVIGQTFPLNAEPYTIVGVLPKSFWFPGDPQLLIPFAWTPQALTQTRGNRMLEIVARLAPGATEDGARSELQQLFAQLAATYPDQNTKDWTIVTFPARERLLGVSRSSLKLLSGAVLLLLAIGCVNVANLLLVRAERRQRATAVRAAVGAGRGRLMRGFLTESLTLASIGSVVGIGLAWLTTRALLSLFGSTLPRAGDVHLGVPVVAFAVGLALLTGLLVGAVPALRIDVERLYDGLREGGRGSTRGGNRLQKSLVMVEVALAVLLVSGAGLLLNSVWRLNRVATGIEPRRALTFQIDLPATKYASGGAVAQFTDRALAAVAAVPGVQSAGVSQRIPLLGGYNITTLASPEDATIQAKFVEIRWVTPDFFRASGIPLLQGRMLTDVDGRDSANIVVISDELAHTLFPDGNALGQWINPGWNATGFEVVGIVGSVREFGVARDKRPAFYRPFGEATGTSRTEAFVVRTTNDDPLSVLPGIRRALAAVDPALPLFGASSMEDVVHRTYGNRRFATTLFAGFAVVALALAALGIFSVLAFAVEQRGREVGIRMALGATRQSVTRMIVGQGLWLTGLGLAIGIVSAVFASRLLRSLLYGVQPADPATLTVVAVVAATTALAASYLPARRAAGIDPMVAVREE